MARIKASVNVTKKEVIAQKAALLFRKKGFAASSMRELAESIGVEAPSLYNHFGSKSEILQIICFKVADEFNVHLSLVEASEETVLKKLENLIRFHIQMMINAYDEVFVANHEWKQLKEPQLNNFLVQRRNYESRLIDIMLDGIHKKEIRPIHPYVAVLTILSAVRGLETWQRHKKNVPVEILAEGMVDHLLNGLTI